MIRKRVHKNDDLDIPLSRPVVLKKTCGGADGGTVVDSTSQQFDFLGAISAARRGDSQGFELLYLRYSREIYVIGVLECYSNPVELVQVTYKSFFDGIGSFMGSEPNFVDSLFTSAMNLILAERIASGQGIDDYVVDNNLANMYHPSIVGLRKLIDRLSHAERRLLYVRAIFGLNQIQAGRVLGISPSECRLLQGVIRRRLDKIETSVGDVGGSASQQKVTS